MTRSEFNAKELEYAELNQEDIFFDSNDVNDFLNEIEDEVKDIITELESIKSVKDLYIVEDVLIGLQKLSKVLY